MVRKNMKELPTLSFADKNEFWNWLESNNSKPEGLWLKIAKKNSGIYSVSYQEALEVALCFGWIDGQKMSFDENYFLQKFTPRRKKSLWSKRNIGIVENLLKAKLIQASGLKEIEQAKADGRWERAYDTAKNMEIPQDFLERLKKNKKAFSFFQTLNKTNLFSIGFRLQTAQKPETREKRILAIIEKLEKKETFH